MQSASWSWACNCCSAGCRYSSSTHANAAPPVGNENNSYCTFTLAPSVTLVAAVSCLLCVSNTCFPCLLKNNRHDCFMTLTCHVGHCAWSENWTSVCGQACAEWINEKRFKILSATRSLKKAAVVTFAFRWRKCEHAVVFLACRWRRRAHLKV